jgi:hypothetical protein
MDNRSVSLPVLFLLATVLNSSLVGQQVPDRTWHPVISQPTWPVGKGPVVCLDEAHANFHTLDDRFWAFGELLRRDGYVVRPSRSRFSAASLGECAIVVIANAQPSQAEWDTYPYPTPSAFAPDEVEATLKWVQSGGSLLLIADHMPLAGAAAALAAAFEVRFLDGFAVAAFEGDSPPRGAVAKPTVFKATDGTLKDHPIVRGRDSSEAVDSVRSFTGQAFQAPPAAEPLLVLPADFILLLPEKAWQFDAQTRRMRVGGWLQGAVMTVGSGRAAFFGEAAMFSAQSAGPEGRPMGMNAPGAEQNYQLVLNLMRWLTPAGSGR